jgi:ribonuclease HI
MHYMSRAMKKQELDSEFAQIEPEDWKYEREIRVTFVYERPRLGGLLETKPAAFKNEFDRRCPVFIETDGACASSEGKNSPGGWGAVLRQRRRICKIWGAKADTSNNEMEYQAMWSALELVPPGAYVCFETDSQQCIDGLTKYRKRWEKHGWRREDCRPKTGDQMIRVKVQVIGERLRETHISTDASIEEILGGAFAHEEVPGGDKFKPVDRPLSLEGVPTSRLERVRTMNRISLDYYTWDDRLLRFGVEIKLKATLAEIVAEAQKKAEEMLEDASHYKLTVNGSLAIPPGHEIIMN